MKALILFLIGVCFSSQLKAQSPEMLDSLRYYPNIRFSNFAYQNKAKSIPGLSYTLVDVEYVVLNNLSYKCISNYVVSGDVVPFGNIYERIDTTSGLVFRSKESLNEDLGGPLSITTVLDQSYNPQTISRIFKDSLEFPLEKLFFAQQPQTGDTIIVGSARFGGSSIHGNPKIDSIAAKDIVVIYKGYRELSDRDLGFDNPADSVFKLIDFEIRYSFSDDSVLTYTLAKDFGLLEVTLISKKDESGAFSIYKAQVYETEVNGREFTRLGLYVNNEKTPELPTKISIQAYPNPFNPATTIRYELPTSGEVTVQVFDRIGRLVQTLEKGFKTFGAHTIAFNASELSSGLYLVRVQSKDDVQTTKVVLIK